MELETQSIWHVQEEECPCGSSPAEKLKFCMRYAVLAPSVLNIQPWIWTLSGSTAALRLDQSRELHAFDHTGRQRLMSCGAALFHLRTAIRRFGLGAEIRLMPDPLRPNLVALVSVAESAAATEDELQLFHAIVRRHTNRREYSDRRVPPDLVKLLQDAAAAEGAWLQPALNETARQRVARLVADGDREQLADPSYRRDVERWLRAKDSLNGDGVPEPAYSMPGLIEYKGPFLTRTFDTGAHYAARERQLSVNAPLLAVLGTDGDGGPDWIRAGQALDRVLLTATAHGVSSSFFDSPLEAPDLRPQVAEAVRMAGWPQMILRFGYGEEVEPSPRRPLSEVVHEEPT